MPREKEEKIQTERKYLPKKNLIKDYYPNIQRTLKGQQ